MGNKILLTQFLLEVVPKTLHGFWDDGRDLEQSSQIAHTLAQFQRNFAGGKTSCFARGCFGTAS